MKRGEENKTEKQCRKQQSYKSSPANKLSASLSNSVWEDEELALGIALCHHRLPDKYLCLNNHTAKQPNEIQKIRNRKYICNSYYIKKNKTPLKKLFLASSSKNVTSLNSAKFCADLCCPLVFYFEAGVRNIFVSKYFYSALSSRLKSMSKESHKTFI